MGLQENLIGSVVSMIPLLRQTDVMLLLCKAILILWQHKPPNHSATEGIKYIYEIKIQERLFDVQYQNEGYHPYFVLQIMWV